MYFFYCVDRNLYIFIVQKRKNREKMNIKGLLIGLGIISLGLLTSCKGGYTCPTYMQNSSEDNQPVMVKELPSHSESGINS